VGVQDYEPNDTRGYSAMRPLGKIEDSSTRVSSDMGLAMWLTEARQGVGCHFLQSRDLTLSRNETASLENKEPYELSE
jgi:hypothetical protein